MKLPEFCKTLGDKLESSSEQERLELSALALQQAFKVAEDEVAFLKLDSETEMLSFLWPVRLSGSGSIPLNSLDALAATTVQENKPQLDNDFFLKRHASVFEQIRLGLAKGKAPRKSKPIQKIMSVPLVNSDTTIGAVQVCRKADEASQAGPDFSVSELEALSAIAKVIALNI